MELKKSPILTPYQLNKINEWTKRSRKEGICGILTCYNKYETLKPEVLDRFKYTECRSPLIVPVPFNKEGDSMMRMLQSCISKNIFRINPAKDEVIVSLKNAKTKPANPYSLDKQPSAYHGTLDALRLALRCMHAKKSS